MLYIIGLEEASGSKACRVINSVSTTVLPLAPKHDTDLNNFTEKVE